MKPTLDNRVSFMLDDETLKWIDSQVESGKYLSRSHVVRTALKKLKGKS